MCQLLPACLPADSPAGKIFFSSTLLHSNFMSIEHRRLMAMRVVEEGNRWGLGWAVLCCAVLCWAVCWERRGDVGSGWLACLHICVHECVWAQTQKTCLHSIAFHPHRLRVIHELRQLVQQKEQFISMMSHELRTPLNGIIGLTSVLLMDAG
jgi:hypothetical protein